MDIQTLKQRLEGYRAGKQKSLNDALATDGAIQALEALIAEEEAELLKGQPPTPETPCPAEPPPSSQP